MTDDTTRRDRLAAALRATDDDGALRAALLRAYEGYPVPSPEVLRLIEDVLGLPRSRAALAASPTPAGLDAGLRDLIRAADTGGPVIHLAVTPTLRAALDSERLA